MSEQEQPSDWFLARDGQQHGPLSDVEIRKIAELGHLRPTDLVWRQGFENWVAAASVFPPPAAVTAPTSPPSPPAPPARPPAPAPPAQSQQRPAPRAGDPRPAPTHAFAEGAGPEASAHAPRAPLAATGYAPGSQPNAGPVHRPSYPHTPGAIDPRARAHPDHAPAAPATHAAAPQGAYGSGAYEPPQTGDPRLGPPSGYDQTAHYDTDENDTASRRFPWMRVAVVMIFAVAIGASAAFYFKGAVSLSGLTQLVAGTSSEPSSAGPPVVRAPREDARVVSTSTSVATNSIVTASSIAVTEQPAVTPAPTQDPTTTPTQSQTPHPSQVTSPVPSQPPTAGAASAALVFGSTATEVDAALQKTKLWPVLKREFSNWYAQQVNDIIRAKAQRKDDIAIANSLAQAVVKLRRDNADAALSASPARLQAVAASFVDNLDRLAKHSTEACYGYISAGEADPVIADLMRNSELAIPLQAQLAAIFEAIADGRRAPRKQGQAQTADFDALATHLGKRGWSPLDLQLFSDARALSRAAPVRVCKMVRDWFTAQLDIQDEAIQIRLLIETLKPVVSG